MRWRWTLALLMALPTAVGPGAADSLSEVLLDWQEGSAAVGLEAVALPNVTTFSWPVWLDGCHRRLFVDLLYEPDNVSVQTGPAGVEVPYRFRASLTTATSFSTRTITDSGYGFALATLPEGGAGWGNLTLTLERGVGVDWQVRLRGMEAFGDPECRVHLWINELESSPAANGTQWVELFNPRSYGIDVDGWVLASNATGSRLTLENVSVPRHGHFAIALPDGFLDPGADSVALLSPLAEPGDATPRLADTFSDSRSWQRGPDGAPDWRFAPSTMGAPNGNVTGP